MVFFPLVLLKESGLVDKHDSMAYAELTEEGKDEKIRKDGRESDGKYPAGTECVKRAN